MRAARHKCAALPLRPLKLLSDVRCDWLTVHVLRDLSHLGREHGEVDVSGWRWTRLADKRTGECTALAHLSGVLAYAAEDPLVPFEGLPVRLTRVDVCREVSGLAVTASLPYFMAGGRGDHRAFYDSPSGRTAYYGSPEGAWRLRIYEKESEEAVHLSEWHSHGWTGEDVTRVEFQLRRRLIAHFGCPTGQAFKTMLSQAWSDALARCRLCSKRPDQYQQACDAPTDPRWRELGEGRKSAPTPRRVRGGPDLALVERQVERWLLRGVEPNKLSAIVAGLLRAHGS